MGVPKRALSKAEEKRLIKSSRKQLSREELAKREIMSISNDLPNDWNDFLNERFKRLMFYLKVKKGEYVGHCECGGEVTLNKVCSGTTIVCPCCKRSVLLKDGLRKRGGVARFEQRQCFAYLVRNGADIISRLFVIYKDTVYAGGSFVESVLTEHEEARDYLYSNGSLYSFQPIQGSNLERWRPGVGRCHGYMWCSWVVSDMPLSTYENNLSEVLKGTPFQYSMLEKATFYNRVNPAYYLKRYLSSPKIELLYKLGLYGVALQYFENTTVSYEVSKLKSPKDIGLETKEDFEACRYYTFDEIKGRKEAKSWQCFKDYESLASLFVSKLNYRCGNDFKYSFLSREGMFNYFLSQKDVLPGRDVIEKISNFLTDYTDYISAAKHLGMNLNDTANSKPKDFKKAHDWAIAHEKAKETQIYDPQIKAVYNELKSLVEWTDGTLSVVLPQDSATIIEEGIVQNHCVGRYCERVAKGESVILFLRYADKLDESFYTMEIKPDMLNLDIVQCRGYENEDRSVKERKLVDAFCEKYTKWFNSRDVGSYEGKIITKYYKAVHKKNGRYLSNADSRMEFKIGEVITEKVDPNPDHVHVSGLHIASMEFAQKFGNGWKDVAILEVEVNIHDVIVPDAMDQVRTSRMRVLREVPMSEMGEWGERHSKAKAA